MSEPLVFVLPLPANMANARFGHWAKKHRAMKDYWGVLDALLITKRLPRRPATPLARATLEIEMHHNRVMDQDGAEARVKWPIDWLVSRGYLVDDRPAHLVRTGLIRQVPCTKHTDRRLVLTLTPLAEAA